MNADALAFNPVFNEDATITAQLIGGERQPLLVIDNVITNPKQMVEFAACHSAFVRPPSGSQYPGLNGALPPRYLKSLYTALQPLLAEVFGISSQGKLYCDGFFGLTQPDLHSLSLLQRTPHYDSNSKNNLAILHYLCRPPYRGTGFYRHKASGFEFVDQARRAPYSGLLSDELKLKEGLPPGFVNDETPFYDQIAEVDVVFNRLAIYRTTSLHCAIMTGSERSPDPRQGRLTANVFIGDPG